MCGIAGIVSLGGPPPRGVELRAMARALVHRGPDAIGAYLGGRAGLVMRRLSVIDLETGAQPVTNEDGRVWAVFNGEIYNYRELRRELIGRGHRFVSESDTETIVHLYEEMGPACVDKLRGMFAFAVWDERLQRLMLARDRIGIKPLYYAMARGRLAFASEVKALLRLPEIPRSLSWPAVDHLLDVGTTPPGTSIVDGILKLEPGHVLLATPRHGVRTRRYWSFAIRPDRSRSPAWFEARLRSLLDETVRLHMISDVPVGAFLSGGIDSSAVVATMARWTGRPIETLSVGFPDPAYDESAPARQASRRLGTRHHEEVVGPEAADLLREITWYLDEPFGDPSSIPTYLLARLAARHVTVVLSGDGGDELFAGYDRYLVEHAERRRDVLPRPLRAAVGAVGSLLPWGTPGRAYLRHLALSGAERYIDAQTLFRRDERRSVLTRDAEEMLPPESPRRGDVAAIGGFRGHWLSALQTHDVNRYLPLDILVKVDRATMAHSLEARVPLLDHVLVEFAATVPPELHLRGGRMKDLLKRAVADRVPASVIDRPKQGFAVPLDAWFRGPLGGVLREILLSEVTASRGIVDTSAVERIIGLHDRGRDYALQLFTLVSLELWCRTFLDRAVAEAPRPARASRHEDTGDDDIVAAMQPGVA
jgi:asparagine synthase (glutamine-hydrolysing)